MDSWRRVRAGSAALLAAAILAVGIGAALAAPAPASALTVTGKTAVVSAADYTVRLAADDPTGTVTLKRDGVTVATAPGVPGGSLLFRGVRFSGLGWHAVQASIAATTSVVSPVLRVRVYAVPPRPVLTTWVKGGLTARRMRVKVQVGTQTYFVAVYVNGKLVRKQTVRPNRVNDLGFVWLPKARNTLTLRAGNGATSTPRTWATRTFAYPAAWKTCIVIDKSELRLYWIVKDVLVKRYPVATGRPSLPTPTAIWRIGVKWTAAENGPYGGRMMGMFMLRRGKYYFTPYFIHGTNKPESIGTYASHGCVRMYPRDAHELFKAVPLYTPVKTQP